uniref:ABC-type transport auxiliary lipoprotein family protein n=1 Tax=Staphylococcus aureus TaxID=1280 RepID=UPI0016629CB3
PLRATDVGQADYQLLLDIRRFRIATDGDPVADIAMSARLVDKTGKVVASRLIEATEKLDKIEPAAAVDAFNAAFARLARELIAWTIQAA